MKVSFIGLHTKTSKVTGLILKRHRKITDVRYEKMCGIYKEIIGLGLMEKTKWRRRKG